MTDRDSKLHTNISLAQSEAEVVRLVMEQTSGLLPSELMQLPPECYGASLRTGEDVAVAAVALVQRDLGTDTAPDDHGARVLRRTMAVFVTAQDRLKQIRSRFTDPSQNPG